jgi:hypothetical protein
VPDELRFTAAALFQFVEDLHGRAGGDLFAVLTGPGLSMPSTARDAACAVHVTAYRNSPIVSKKFQPSDCHVCGDTVLRRRSCEMFAADETSDLSLTGGVSVLLRSRRRDN